jgi:hypothetical protein
VLFLSFCSWNEWFFLSLCPDIFSTELPFKQSRLISFLNNSVFERSDCHYRTYCMLCFIQIKIYVSVWKIQIKYVFKCVNYIWFGLLYAYLIIFGCDFCVLSKFCSNEVNSWVSKISPTCQIGLINPLVLAGWAELLNSTPLVGPLALIHLVVI